MSSTNKTTKIIYWVSTGILAAFTLPGIFFMNSKEALDGTAHLGLPLWFHYEVSVGKFIGAVILILPLFPKRIKEWAYVAFGIDFLSAVIAHLAVDGMASMWYFPLVFFVILLISYVTYHQLQEAKL
ncbi:DoxX-like family protein [Pedobacter westerhofensis]|uniref:DoxX-like family protein n=1 Tax=Pedobacter westerhofensis TaxID=425512 RepID=A0A521CNG7_9SPHI|nr:DoxX family protein [Pedobacter westerhofensis]SMO60983.1 DoxX-like family protein [Pedobacter westerhofensis]